MKLIQNPSSHLLAYVETIQQNLSRHGNLSFKQNNDAFFEHLSCLARSRASTISKEEKEEFELLSTQLKLGFGIIEPDEFLRRIDEAKSLTTSYELTSRLFDFLDLWHEVQYFTTKVSIDYNHDNTSILLATAAHKDHNARAFMHKESNVHIVMFYDRLFDFFADISLLLPISVLPNELVLDKLSEFPSFAYKLAKEPISRGSTVQSYLKAFFARHYGGNFSNSRFDKAHLSESIRLIGQDIEQSMKAFIMGHEIAHILCNHEGERKYWHFTALDDRFKERDICLSEIVRNWDEEYEADYVGFKLGHGVSLGYQIPFETYAWSVLLFFTANQWLMTLQGWDDTVIDSMSEEERFRTFKTHPPLHFRRCLIEKIILDDNNGEIPHTIELRPIERLIEFVQPFLDEHMS